MFLLTDGDVTNADQVINLVRENNKNARTFSIGIGSGCSTYLVKETAKAGFGVHEIVHSNDQVIGKVISLLKASTTPCLVDFKIEYPEDLIEFVIPDP